MVTATQSIGHFQPRANILRRSEGDSAAGKAAYNARCTIENERTGKVYSFDHLPNKVLGEYFYPAAHAPEWAKTRQGYWNAVERRENRADSQLAMDWIIDLPHQLQQNPDHARLILQDFIRENFTRKGYGADLVFHPAHDHGDERNFHAHLMVGIRKFEKDGSWSSVKDGVPNPEKLYELRERMAVEMNHQLKRFGYDIRVDHRSNAERGIDREATIHLGKDAAALERRGVRTEKGDENREIEERNAERVRVRTFLHEMTPQEIETTLDRLRREDEEARIEAQRGIQRDASRGASVSQADKEMLSAVRRLFVTMGSELGNVIPIDRGDLRGQGAAFRSDAVEERRKIIADAQEKAAREAQQHQEEQQRRRVQEQLAAYREGLEKQLAKEGYLPGPILPNMGATAAPSQDEEREIANRREIQERLAQYRAELEKQIAKERNYTPPGETRRPDPREPERQGPAPASPTREAAPRQRAGSDRSASWMAQTGGYENLSADLKASADKSYAKWVEKNPDKAAKLDRDGYVAFTQEQEHKRAAQREELKQNGMLREEPEPHPARRMERKLHIKRGRRKREDEYET